MNRTLLFFILVITQIPAYAGVLEFTQAQITVVENSSTFDVSISRTGDASGTASVTIKSIADTATVVEDYVNISQVVNWIAGDSTSKTVTVTIEDDAIVEGTETFALELSSFTGDTAGTTDTSEISITDYEEGTLSFVFTSYSVSEDSEIASINVLRQSGFDGDVSVTLKTSDDTALKEVDYEETDIEIDFEDGESSKIVEISIVNDDIGEISESVTLTLSDATNDASLGTNATASLTIVDTDSNFTPALDLLETSTNEITVPERIDLSQTSLNDSELTLLDTINRIEVLESTDLSAAQNSSGIVEVAVGDETIYLSPVSATRSTGISEASILIRDDQSGKFYTDQDISIDFNPALQGLSTLQTELALLSMPDVVITGEGNITIQIDQGPPPLELNDEGIVIVNNRYWDRYNLRPSVIGFISPELTAGIKVIPHSSLPQEASMLVIFADGQNMRQQLLNTSPPSYSEFANYIEENSAYSNLSVVGGGVFQFDFEGSSTQVFSDYIVRRSVDFEPSKVGIFAIDDINGDELADFNVVYSSGDEQYLVTIQ